MGNLKEMPHNSRDGGERRHYAFILLLVLINHIILADNRSRVHGRFACNYEPGEIPKASMFRRYEDEGERSGVSEAIFEVAEERGERRGASGD
ncbi:hypothetical protein BUALT_Bualt18G0083200 [Buddleja alternifolia]|uniref:Uncharacterized protein n=1 Tax=Buddleja alternifolia TaxID=168488 RepID=A0AAV6WDX7_9LAMI|nr:hypothetical protein BUALT_Bualt18G0083200 [Buddleja alternifolia]